VLRHINIDWLEVYAMEDPRQYPCDAEYYRQHGWMVREREYGTRVYKEMFTLLDAHDEPLLEIRRAPYSNLGRDGGIFPVESCHIRLHNRTCYAAAPVAILRDFMARYGYTLVKIYRIDICLDFEKFDFGDDPGLFVERFMRGRYAKVNQTEIAAHGVDLWNGRLWNSLSWGKPKSMISTKMYCKSMELEKVHDKPYIWLSWMGDAEHRGLIDDPINHTKRRDDGTVYKPVIWRIEFSIKSSAKRVFVIEGKSRKSNVIVMPHTLDMYDSKMKLLTMFASLQTHYFHFKHFEVEKRKDRCKDKQLFRFEPSDTFYKIDRLASHTAKSKPAERFLTILRNYRLTHTGDEVRQACDVLIDVIEKEMTTEMLANGTAREEIMILRRLIAERIGHHDLPIVKQTEEIKNIISLLDDQPF